MTREVIRDAWLRFTEPLEGGVPYLYADIRGLITIAYGNLVDPLSAALSLPFVRPDGSRASATDISAAWLSIKGDPNAARKGHLYARQITSLRLTPDGMRDIALGKLDANDAALRARYAEWDNFPACAQMALHSLAWACGAAYRFPRLDEAVRASDWDVASVHIQMRETTPEGVVNAGLRPRNKANRTLMSNAERVRTYGLDPDTIEWRYLLGARDISAMQDLSTLGDDDDTPRYPTTTATHLTMGPQAIVHVDPAWYTTPPSDDDPDAA